MEKVIQHISLKGNLSENWRKLRQQFEIYSIATELNKKNENVQCAQLLHLMEEDAINVFNTFTFLDEENDNIEVLKKKFKDNFVPKKNLMYERYKFFTYRQTTETIEQLQMKASQ